jgi:nitroreductase
MATFRTAFGVPLEYTPIGVLSIGYAAPDRRSPSLRRGRRPVSDVVHRGTWRNE